MKPLISWLLIAGLTIAPSPGLTFPVVDKGKPAAGPADGGWPRTYQSAFGARIVLYEPQVASWVDQKRMTLYSAVSYLASGASKPTIGTVRIEADTKVALSERLVNFSDFTIAESQFPSLDNDTRTKVVDEIKASVPTNDRV